MEIAASRRDRCATMSSIGSEATGAWLRRHAIAEDMGRTSRALRGDSSPMSFAPKTFTTGMLSVPKETRMRWPGGWGFKYLAAWVSVTACHAQIFFAGGKPLITFPEIKQFKRPRASRRGAGQSSSITWLVGARLPRSAPRLFCRIVFRTRDGRPRGVKILAASSPRDRMAAARIFSRNSGIFLCAKPPVVSSGVARATAAGSLLRKKTPRNSGWGVGMIRIAAEIWTVGRSR
jgi:hypothetical protein